MPLSLTDSRWSELRSSYGDTKNVIAWLAEAQRGGSLTTERLGDLINEVEHQGGTSTAMYAVAAHLISLARHVTPLAAIPLLTHAGVIYANSDRPGAVPCPAFLLEEFTGAAPEGAQMLAKLVHLATDFDVFKWAVAGLAGFLGHHRFGRFLDGLDFHDGRFHHVVLGGPFPEV